MRLFLQRDTKEDYRYIAWFELRDRDFYWGPPWPVPDIEGISFAGTSLSIMVPSDLDKLPRARWKASRHASGVMHVNTDGSGALHSGDAYVGPIEDIRAPTIFAALIDKHPSNYPPCRGSLTRGGSSALVIRIPESQWNARQYLEFYLSPAGSFPTPTPMLRFDRPLRDTPACQSLDPDLDVVLAVRHATLGKAFSDWRPGVGIWCHIDHRIDPPIQRNARKPTVPER